MRDRYPLAEVSRPGAEEIIGTEAESRSDAAKTSSRFEVRVLGARPTSKTTWFQIRWNEALGKPECPYMRRWVFILFGFGIRFHRWYRSDDKRFFHDHPWWFLTLVIQGSYTDWSLNRETGAVTTDHLSVGSIRFRPSSHLHCVDVPVGGSTTIVISGPHCRNWGFWVHDKIMRPLRFFSRYGHPPCSEQ